MAHDEATNANGYAASDVFDVLVAYTWHGSPAKDYTVKVYSKHAHTLYNYDDE